MIGWFDQKIIWEYRVWQLSSKCLFQYKPKFFTKRPIYLCWTNNIVEILNVSLIKKLLDKRRYKSSLSNTIFYEFTFDGDKKLITRQRLYCINDNIVLRLINGSSVYVKKWNARRIKVYIDVLINWQPKQCMI